MGVEILMPALSPTMTEGKLARWLKKVGDTVSAGDVIAEIETDKATMEVEAVDEGTLGEILVAEGTDGVAVNAPIAVLLAEGEDASSAKPAAEAPASLEATEQDTLRVLPIDALSAGKYQPRKHWDADKLTELAKQRGVTEAAHRWGAAGFELEFTGPWPPYHFAADDA